MTYGRKNIKLQNVLRIVYAMYMQLTVIDEVLFTLRIANIFRKKTEGF